MQYFPIAVKLKNKRVLVLGGGNVAERKVLSLLEAGAKVCVVSPDLTKQLSELFELGQIEWIDRKFQDIDIYGIDVVIAATNNSLINKRISQLAHARNILVNIVDEPILSSFISPAVIRSKNAIIAVYTDGTDPVLSRDLKNYLKEKWDEFIRYRNRS